VRHDPRAEVWADAFVLLERIQVFRLELLRDRLFDVHDCCIAASHRSNIPPTMMHQCSDRDLSWLNRVPCGGDRTPRRDARPSGPARARNKQPAPGKSLAAAT